MSEEAVWKREGNLLEEAAGSISTLRKEISKEAEIDVAVQSSIKQKIESLKQNATQIANKLENEKHKNAELQAIIRYMQGKIEKQKLMEATNRDNISFQSLTSLQGRYKKLEYDLSHLSGKLNRMCENVETKKSKISQNRTQRVIDSGIFRNIEKELIASEFKFKKLLIQKIKYKNEYQKMLKEYEELKQKAQACDVQRDNTKTKTNKNNSRIQTDNQSLLQQKKFIQIQNKQTKPISHYRSAYESLMDSEIEEEQQRKSIIVQKLLSDLRLENCEQLLENFENLQRINESCFNEMNNYSNQIDEIEKYLSVIQHQKKARKIGFYKEKREMSKIAVNLEKKKDLKLKIHQAQAEIEQQTEKIGAFLNQQQFKDFQKQIDLQPIPNDSFSGTNFQAVIEGLRSVQQSIQQYLRQQKVKIEEEHQGITVRAASQEKLLDMLNRVKYDQCMTVMKKEEFKEEYNKLVKVSSTSKRTKVAHSNSKISNNTYRK